MSRLRRSVCRHLCTANLYGKGYSSTAHRKKWGKEGTSLLGALDYIISNDKYDDCGGWWRWRWRYRSDNEHNDDFVHKQISINFVKCQMWRKIIAYFFSVEHDCYIFYDCYFLLLVRLEHLHSLRKRKNMNHVSTFVFTLLNVKHFSEAFLFEYYKMTFE